MGVANLDSVPFTNSRIDAFEPSLYDTIMHGFLVAKETIVSNDNNKGIKK